MKVVFSIHHNGRCITVDCSTLPRKNETVTIGEQLYYVTGVDHLLVGDEMETIVRLWQPPAGVK